MVKARQAQAGIGADIRRRLVAADMLLAGGERQHETALALGIHRLAAQGALASGATNFWRAAKSPT